MNRFAALLLAGATVPVLIWSAVMVHQRHEVTRAPIDRDLEEALNRPIPAGTTFTNNTVMDSPPTTFSADLLVPSGAGFSGNGVMVMNTTSQVSEAAVADGMCPICLAAEIERLRAALRIIAGEQQCVDNLMSNQDVARAALEQKSP